MEYKGVVFSGLPGSGKSKLVEKIAEIYGWREFSVGGLWRQRWQRLYPDAKVTFEEYWRNVSVEDIKQINIDALEVYKKGAVASDSRYSIYLKDFPLLLVFVTASLDVRALRAFDIGKYKKSGLEEIKRILLSREQDELKAGKELFNYDYRDCNYYHLALNSGYLSLDQEIAIVKNALI